MFNYFVLIMLLFVVVQYVRHEVKETVNINVYNFLNNDLIFNPLALLELSQSSLCISCIRFDKSILRFN